MNLILRNLSDDHFGRKRSPWKKASFTAPRPVAREEPGDETTTQRAEGGGGPRKHFQTIVGE